MKQEDLKNLKIEDLEEVTEGYWKDGEEMIVSHCHFIENHDDIQIKNVFAFVKGANNPVITKDKDGIIACVNKAYKIPQPKMRDMNSLEVMEYLHLLQMWVNGAKTLEEIKEINKNFELPEIKKAWVNFKCMPVVSKRQANPGLTYSWSINHHEKSGSFGVSKNGKVTEFKLPQIEA